MPLVHHGHQERGGRHPGRRRRPRTRHQIVRQPHRHRGTHLRIQLVHPRQVLAYRQPQPVRHRRQIQPGEPPGQPRRRRRHRHHLGPRHPLADHQRPREHVPEPPSPRRHQRGDARDRPEGQDQLHDPHGPADQSVPEPDRPAVVPYDPQPAGELAERTPVGQRLHRDRHTHQEQQEARHRHGRLGGLVQRGGGHGQPDRDEHVSGDVHGQVQEDRQPAARQPRGPEPQDDSVPRHQIAHHSTSHVTCPAPTASSLPS